MRSATLPCLLLVLLGLTANAQKLSLTPQFGFENPNTSMKYNEGDCFTPINSQVSPQLGVRFDYMVTKKHGAYLGIGSSRSGVAYNFSDPESGQNVYTASKGEYQFSFTTGYRYNSKPIFFNKNANSKSTTTAASSNNGKKSCGSAASYSSRCGKKTENPVAKANKGSYVRIQPMLGLAFIPGNVENLEGSGSNYTYNAGNWKTAFTTGAGFEFGNAKRRLFTVNVNYFKGLSDMDETLSTTVSGKTTTTHLQSRTSGWNFSVGIPFTLDKKKEVAKKAEVKKVATQKQCGEIKYKCRKVI